jgi:NAD(P)-dependent dehydrogenase (short-subunit alcohol dehydrogenase family)
LGRKEECHERFEPGRRHHRRRQRHRPRHRTGAGRRGCHLALADIDAGRPEGNRLDARTLGVRVTTHVLDVADREAVRMLPGQVTAPTSGSTSSSTMPASRWAAASSRSSEDDFDWLMDINFNGVVRMTRAFLPLPAQERRSAHRERLEHLRHRLAARTKRLFGQQVRGARLFQRAAP